MVNAYLVEKSRDIMRGKQASPRETPFAKWLYEERNSRGLTMVVLAGRAGVSHPRIVQLEKGDTPSRDMVARLAAGLSANSADEHTTAATLNAGLRAAGFATTDEPTTRPMMMFLEQKVRYSADGETRDLTPAEADQLVSELEELAALRIAQVQRQGKA